MKVKEAALYPFFDVKRKALLDLVSPKTGFTVDESFLKLLINSLIQPKCDSCNGTLKTNSAKTHTVVGIYVGISRSRINWLNKLDDTIT